MNLKALLADDDAVSPVIGVILMVAITVILAAVIGTFVLGLGENVSQNASAGVSEASGNDYKVTLNSLGPSTDGIKCAGVDVDSAEQHEYTESVGTTITCDDSGEGDNPSTSVVAYGTDVQDATVFTFDEDGS